MFVRFMWFVGITDRMRNEPAKHTKPNTQV
jgi:hypothetical protein